LHLGHFELGDGRFFNGLLAVGSGRRGVMNQDQAAQTGAEGTPSAGEIAGRRRRWPWVLLLLAIGLVVGVRALLPLAVERGAAYGSRYYLGLPVRIDNADFSLTEGTVVLEGVSVGAKPDEVSPTDAALTPPPIDPATALLHWSRVAVHLSWNDLRRHTFHLTDLVLESPSIRVERESDGKIDPLRYARPLAEEAQSEPSPAGDDGSAPWKVVVDKFELRSPDVVVVDPPTGQNLLEFSLEQFLLESVAVQGSDFSLGGIGIEGPVLRVRRDLVLADTSVRGASAKSEAGGETAAAVDVAQAKATPEATPDASSAEAAPDAGSAEAASAGTADSASAPAVKERERSGYRIAKIDIARAKFTWITDQGPLDVALALKASDLTMDQGKRFPLDLQLQIGEGKIGVAGEVGILPPAYHGTFDWSGLPFPPLLLAALPQFAPWLRSADSKGDLKIDADLVAAEGPAGLRISGRTSVESVAIADPKGDEAALGWKQLEVVASEVLVPLSEQGRPSGTTRVVLDSVRLVEPKIRYTRPSPALDALLGRPSTSPVAEGKGAGAAKTDKAATVAAAAAAPAAASGGATATPPLVLSVASLELLGGDFELNDNTVKPAARSHIRDLSLSAKDVRFPETAAAAIRVRAILPDTATLSIDGDLKPGNNGDFTVVVQKLDLPTFSPYAAAAGATLDAGQASLETKVRMRGGKTALDNDLLLRRFGVSLRDPSSFERSFGVPIDLALALLRDPSGNISLNIPVRIDEKGASVSMGAVIASALRQAMVGAVTAPLKMLGAAFGGGGSQAGGLGLDPIANRPGSDELADGQKGRIDALVQLLSQRPNVGLLLRGRVGPEDRPVVAQQVLTERWKAGEAFPDVEGSGFLARRRIGQALLKTAKGEAPKLSDEDRALYERTAAAVPIPEARLQALARSRAERARTLLLEQGVVASRVAAGDPEAEGTPAVVIGLKTK